ncbi:MAG: radical SAM protein [Syntrophaceticus schinkii]|nr:radical SAM protein [Syntrophaceticus schinkii]MDD4260586.1 radical SAM protein [Syntrophaceticus schinkii]MDD4674190.1 radical SAM protein [Syntrophaceticus schinkii]
MLVSWNTTNACNLKCPHCYRDAGREAPQELSTTEGYRLLEEVKKAGFKIIVFSGGEPILRPDLCDLIARAKSLGLRPVLGTNGTLLTEEKVQQLKEAGAAAVGISVDSIDPEKHDHFRGIKGAWEATHQGIINCHEGGLPFQIHTTVFPWNYSGIEKITDFALQAGARGHHVFFYVPTGRGKKNIEETITSEQMESLLERLISLQEQLPLEIKPTCAPQFMRIARQLKVPNRFSRGCLAGISYCIIGPQGDVYPCPYMDLKISSVRETPFSEIWSKDPVLLKLRTQKYGGYCSVCKYRGTCGGCRARAFAGSEGNFMAGDPSCLYGSQEEIKMYPLAIELLLRLQEGLPVVKRPYSVIAEELAVSEQEIFKTLRWLKENGLIRRLGGIFDSRRLGYASTLCAAKVPQEQLQRVVEIINSYQGVTHNYLREHNYNLWFTVTAPSPVKLEQVVREIQERTGLKEFHSLPSQDLFKIAVKFSREELTSVFQKRRSCTESLTE